MKSKSNNIFGKVFYILMLVFGMVLGIWSCRLYPSIDIGFYGKFDPNGKDGNALIVIGVISLAIVLYAGFQLLLLKDSESDLQDKE